MTDDDHNEADELANVAAETLDEFVKLDRETQEAIVRLYRRHANDKSLPNQEREIARARAKQFRAAKKPKKRPSK